MSVTSVVSPPIMWLYFGDIDNEQGIERGERKKVERERVREIKIKSILRMIMGANEPVG